MVPKNSKKTIYADSNKFKVSQTLIQDKISPFYFPLAEYKFFRQILYTIQDKNIRAESPYDARVTIAFS